MERYKGALKSSLVGELAFLSVPIPIDQIKENYKDFLGFNGAEDFSNIDCFFDFGDFKDGYDEKTLKDPKHEDEEDGINVDDDSNSNSSASSNSFLDHSELCASVNHLEELEWPSKFVEDSSSEHHPVLYTFEPEPRPVSVKPSFVLPFHVPTKRRTKRPRQIGRTWFGSPLTDYSSSSSSSSFSSSTPCLIYAGSVQTVDIFHGWSEPAAKKPKKRSQTSVRSTQFQRRCSHCRVNKTPQWRTGPLGPKTLCNACGVRYKSGRLFPEYRPACSPTFSSDIHSNSHRKVLEIRRKTKEGSTVEPNCRPNGLDVLEV